MSLPGIAEYRRTAFKSIPGWMHDLDLDLFDRILDHQLTAGITGDILEIGSYHGKSAIALGHGLRDDEQLHVCDMFGAPFVGVPCEGIDDYTGLTISDFAKQYTRFHDRAPIVQQCPSSLLNLDGLLFRFAHIDGGHAYDVVRDDINAVRKHVEPLAGVIALDDYRSVHTPGVSAAVWQAAANATLYPFLLSEVKVYAAVTRAGQDYWLDVCRQFELPAEEHTMHGYNVRRAWH